MNAAERKLFDQSKLDLISPLEDGDFDAANAASLSNKLLQILIELENTRLWQYRLL